MDPALRQKKDILAKLVKTIAYMFYKGPQLLIVEYLLNSDHPLSTIELEETTKLANLVDIISPLKRDGIVTPFDVLDTEGKSEAEVKRMSEAQKKKHTVTYYGIDYKVFCDSVYLKIMKCREALEKRCGRPTDINYKCIKCEKIFSTEELLRECDPGELHCLDCESELEVCDIKEEVNKAKFEFQQFKELTDPILEDLSVTNGLVIIDTIEKRYDLDSIMTEVQYQKNEVIINENKTNSRSSGSFNIAQTVDAQNHVIIDEQKEEKHDLNLIQQLKEETKKEEFSSESDPYIVINDIVINKTNAHSMIEKFDDEGNDDAVTQIEDFLKKYE